MKKKFLIALFGIISVLQTNAQERPLKIVIFGAHPDDCDLKAGGTAIRFAQLGHRVKFVSLTNGDSGHQSMSGTALAKRRWAEAMEAGKRFGVEYTVLDNHDGQLMPTLENRLKVIREIRNWEADIVISHRPNDYHPDHRYTGVLVQDAAYLVIVPNVAPDVAPLKKNPLFLYMMDNFQKPNPFMPTIAVDIDGVFNQKIYAMSAHESQFFEWLPWTQGAAALAEVPINKDERLKWLASKRQYPITPAMRESLVKWYGEEHAGQVKNAEAFEICEYGLQPSDEQIKELFPMLGLKEGK
ncbi:MAG TPA: GlcNAc-PI de-N-acetylase [Prolixibacteraceae bacterium]|jgi:LmbE family N-acetylglucosaminyl deacetylase|nr:GlcNAc-PI de-N-acetylase [Prolixibacteraceae bacterium]